MLEIIYGLRFDVRYLEFLFQFLFVAVDLNCNNSYPLDECDLSV